MMNKDCLHPEQSETILLKQSSSARKDEDLPNAQDDSLPESRRTCSSTDSGRSSISSSNIIQCDELTKKRLATDIEGFLSSGNSAQGDHSTTDVYSKDAEENREIFADVTLLPKTSNVMIIQGKDSKMHSKRNSRSKGCKSTKARKTGFISKAPDCKDNISKEDVSQDDGSRDIVTERKGITTTLAPTDTNLLSTEMLKQPFTSTDNIADNILTTDPYVANAITVIAKNNCSRIDSETLNEDRCELNTISHQNAQFSDKNKSENETEILTVERRGRNSFQDRINSDSPNKLSSMDEIITPMVKCKPLKGEDVPSNTTATLFTKTKTISSEQDSPETLNILDSPKHITTFNPKSAPVVDDEKTELKLCSYSSSSSPIPSYCPKFRESPFTNKRCARASGSTTPSNYTPTGKTNSSNQLNGKYVPVRPLLPMELYNNQTFGSHNFRKQLNDRSKRNVETGALLPNPLFQSANCLCATQPDIPSLLINQPLYWWLPSVQLAQCSQLNNGELQPSVVDAKSKAQSLLSITQTDGSTINLANLQSVRQHMAPIYATIDGTTSNTINAALCNQLNCMQLIGNQVATDVKKVNVNSNHTQQTVQNSYNHVPQSLCISVETESKRNSNEGSTLLEKIVTNVSDLEQEKSFTRNLESKKNTLSRFEEIGHVGDFHTSNGLMNVSQPRSLFNKAEFAAQRSVSSNAIVTSNAESNIFSHSNENGPIAQESNSNQMAQNVIAYNSTDDPFVLPTNCIYMYNAGGQLFAIPSTALIYPTQAQLSLNDVVSGTDSAYSSPPTIYPNQVIQETNFQPTFATNFDASLGLLGANQDIALGNFANFGHLFNTAYSNQLAFAEPVAPSCQTEANQWPNVTLPLEIEQRCALNHISDHPIRPLYFPPNLNSSMQNSYDMMEQTKEKNTRSDFTQTPVPSSSEKQVKERFNKSNSSYTRTTHSQVNKPMEILRPVKGNTDSCTGLLGSAKSTGSILGDSKSMVLHPVTHFVEDITHNGSFVQNSHNRQKKHSSKTNLYIRGLPSTFTEEQLHTLAPDRDLIRSVKLIVGNEGEMYGFIDFTNNVAARAALHHIKLTNRELYVNFAYESEKDPQNVYITNIPETWTAANVEDLKKIFQPYGQIATAIVMTKRSNNFCTGAGFVRFVKAEDAQSAIEGIRTAQVKLEGGKGPLEVKLADRQKPMDDQSSLSKSRISKPFNEDKHLVSSDGLNETPIDSSRKCVRNCNKKSSGCLYSAQHVLPLLDLSIPSNSPSQRVSGNLASGPGLLPSVNNQIGQNRHNNHNAFAMVLQNAMNGSPIIHSSLMMPNSLNTMNFSLPTNGETPSIVQSNFLTYRAPVPPIANLIPQQRSPRVNTGLLQNPPLSPSIIFSGQSGLLPLVRSPLEELNYNSSSIGFTGTHPQSTIFGQALQPNGRWANSTLIPGMFASM